MLASIQERPTVLHCSMLAEGIGGGVADAIGEYVHGQHTASNVGAGEFGEEGFYRGAGEVEGSEGGNGRGRFGCPGSPHPSPFPEARVRGGRFSLSDIRDAPDAAT